MEKRSELLSDPELPEIDKRILGKAISPADRERVFEILLGPESDEEQEIGSDEEMRRMEAAADYLRQQGYLPPLPPPGPSRWQRLKAFLLSPFRR